MRISAIQSGSSVYARKNKVQNRLKDTVTTPATEQQQPVAFKGSGLKIGLGAAGAIIGGLVIGGPVGALVGLAAGLSGAKAAEDQEALDEEKRKNNKK